MSCTHSWEIVDYDVAPFRTVYSQYCLACHATRKVIVWEDGEVEHVYDAEAEA